MRASRAVVGILVGMLLVPVAACTAEEVPEAAPSPSESPLPTELSSPVDVPAGWETYRAQGVSFAHPPDWKIIEQDRPVGSVTGVEGPVGEGELPQQVVLTLQPDFTGDLTGLVTTFQELRELPEQQVVRDEPVAVQGAVEARITERTFAAPAAGGTSVPARVLELRAITDDRTAVGFLVRSAQSDYGTDLQRVFESFRVDAS